MKWARLKADLAQAFAIGIVAGLSAALVVLLLAVVMCLTHWR